MNSISKLNDIVDNGLRIKELYNLNSKEFNLKEEEGINNRIKKI
tara:strand:- start:476 stop:607 length:132 start_codon:yes stop_codon:yes gene_type:complete